MIRHLLYMVIAFGSQCTTPTQAEEHAILRSRSINADINNNQPSAHAVASAPDGSLQIKGDPTAVTLEVRQTSVTGVLASLATAYAVSYSSAVKLDELRDGTYEGPLRRVIAHVLEGYDYVIEENQTTLDVLVLGKSGQQGVPTPTMPVVRQHRIPVTSRISRVRS